MKLLQIHIVLLAFVCLQLNASGAPKVSTASSTNNKATIPMVGIGDQLSAFCLSNPVMMGNTKKTIKEHINKKHVIIDFFATWCKACVEALPRIDSIQKFYGDKIAVIVVTREPKSVIANFLQNNPVARTIDLSFIVEDSILNSVFPHIIIPHEIWLNETLQVMAITSNTELTDPNLKNFVGNIKFSLPEKKELTGYDEEMPLFENGNGGSPDKYLSRSILAKTNVGLGGRTHILPGINGTIARVTITNMYPLFFFFNAYAFHEGISELTNPKRIIMETKDSTSGRDYNDRYTYEMSAAKPQTLAVTGKYMMEDFNRYFNIQGTIEKRVRPCWVIHTGNIGNKKASAYKKAGVDYVEKSIAALVVFLNDAHHFEPVIAGNDVDREKTVNITYQEYYKRHADIMAIAKELEAQGYQIVIEPQPINVLVIRDK